ncbi:MAG: response regulator, partial [Desulfocapsa sp.]|nr:response regulator [Desulfocapsa sp.]
QKMEAIGTLAGGIAHDFNNILGAMLGFTQMAMDEIPKKSQAYKDLSEVLQSGDRAADLVKQILLFGRHQNQGHVPVQIQFLIKEAIKMLRASLSASIVIEENIDVDCPSIMADPTQIYQVLINLCANSRQAMLQHGGTLSIGLSHTDFSKDDLKMPANVAPGQYIKITIEDTGSGIEEKTLSRIFDPFFTTKSIGEGTGLGLAVVHGIIKSHHGHISVKSTLQEGTKFTVLLPVDETDTKVEPIANNDTLPTGTEHILVVDDEPNILLIRERLLLKLGYQVSTFGNGLEALEAFQKEPLQYDLLLVDMAMPGMDGKEFIANIKKITPDVPAILCTGNAELLTKDQAIQYGFCDLLEKPIKPLPLAKAIRRYLNEK